MHAQRGISARGADANSVRKNFDLPKLGNIPNVDQFSVGQLSGRVENHQVSPAGDGQPLSWLPRQQEKNSRQIARRHESVVGWIGSHVRTLRRPALATASQICM